MTIVRTCALLSVIFLINTGTKCEKSKLLSVATLYRHGDRGPVALYKNDPYLAKAREIWPEGLGQLTNKGIQQQYDLGKWYRNYYKEFIPERYDSKFIRVQSSDVDRCLTSAASNLAGLFPPKGKQVWNKDLPWIPIPIHTTPVTDDYLIAGMKSCPKYVKLVEDVMKSKELDKFINDRKSLMDYVQKNGGDMLSHIPEPIPTLVYMGLFHDILTVENATGLILPEWTKNIFPDKTMEFQLLFFKKYSWTPQMRRLKSGPLLDYILSFFEQVLVKPTESQKFLMLSCHDITIANMAHALGLLDNVMPEYSSSLTFELRSKNSKPFINIMYKDSQGTQKLSLKNCNYDCSFERFSRLTNKVRINLVDWQKECTSL